MAYIVSRIYSARRALYMRSRPLGRIPRRGHAAPGHALVGVSHYRCCVSGPAGGQWTEWSTTVYGADMEKFVPDAGAGDCGGPRDAR
jgi:hypothetical protein